MILPPRRRYCCEQRQEPYGLRWSRMSTQQIQVFLTVLFAYLSVAPALEKRMMILGLRFSLVQVRTWPLRLG